MANLNELETLLIVIAVLAICVGLPLVVRRATDSWKQNVLVRKNSRTLRYHYEHASDVAQYHRLPAELKVSGFEVQVQFALEFESGRSSAAERAQQCWIDLESIGLVPRTARSGERLSLVATVGLPSGDSAAITRVRLQVQDVAARHGAQFAGWTATGPLKRAG